MVFDMLDEMCEAHWSNVMVVHRRTFLDIEVPCEDINGEEGLLTSRARAFTDSAAIQRQGDSDDEFGLVLTQSSQSLISTAPTECLSGGESVTNDDSDSVCSLSVDQEEQKEYELRQTGGGAMTTHATFTGPSWAQTFWMPAMSGVLGYSMQMSVGGAPHQHFENFELPPAASSPLSEPTVATVGRWADCEDDEVILPQAAYPEWHPLRSQRQGFDASTDNHSQSLDGPLPHERTTVMFKNLPMDWTRDNLAKILNAEGFCAEYDFVHVPVKFVDFKNIGYALVNCTSNASADRMLQYFEGFEIAGGNQLSICWSQEKQGLAAHVERYRDSPMMHCSVPERYRPGLFRDGIQLAFPSPTKNLRAPRVRRQKADAAR